MGAEFAHTTIVVGLDSEPFSGCGERDCVVNYDDVVVDIDAPAWAE